MRCLSFLSVLSLVVAMAQASDDISAQDVELFELHVRPVLVDNCIKCHGDAKQEGSLRLTKFEELLRGGESGPAIVPGKPDESLLLEALRYESFEMPPEKPLDSKLIAGIEKWIAAGAPWPKLAVLRPDSSITDEDREWWCIQPISDPQVPEVQDNGWCRNEIDHFIFARLEKEGIHPTERADLRTLTRRAHFALTGLPPSPELLADPPELKTQIDTLLNDPAYGENQAKFWLDLVRYADSDGYNADHVRPDAYHYRDYVVRSFNADKPYDRFIKEQLAGDEIDPGNKDALIGTMYLRHWIYEWNQRDVEGQWAEILSDVTETTADVFLGLSMKCARCHDHKFDPLLQKDYYRLLSFFKPLQPRDEMPLGDLEAHTAYYNQLKEWENATEDIRKRLHEIEHPVLLKHATREGFDKFIEEIRDMIVKMEEERTPYEHQIASMACRQFDLHPDKLSEWLSEEEEAERQELRKQLAEFDHLKPEPLPTLKFLASDVSAEAPPTFIPDRENDGEILPGFPTILDEAPAEILPAPEALQSTGRRTALANWLASPENPLTARVIVNRVWMQHFGRGIVESTNDFGHLGTPPTHPELLDWLASRFIEDGWSLKKLHQRILSSATWQQRSDRLLTEELKKIDPANELLWRMNPRRLSAEEVVDAMLFASGELGKEKRALYRQVRRNHPDPQMGLYDFPDRIRSKGQRHNTTTSNQALMLLNNDWPNARATALQRKLAKLPDDEFIQSAYQRLFFREANEDERAGAQEFLSTYTSLTPEPEPPKLLGKLPNGLLGIDLDPEKKTIVRNHWFPELPNGDFTVEATVLLRSLYPDANVRTLVAHWNNSQKHSGWSLGVTSTKSAYQPKNLILQLVGENEDGQLGYEVVASDLRVELNKPYYVAVSVDLDDTSEKGITFYLKDLSDKNSPVQTAQAAHQAVRNISLKREVEIGSRVGGHLWDGLIHNVRLHNVALTSEQLTAENAENLLFDVRFTDNNKPGTDVSGHNKPSEVIADGTDIKSPREQARVALLHALLNSNEMIYVD
ncbi:MAG: DUF1553 domain-containing protein [Planctomycetaceae bacterium]|nr:DUF1553 domain-containing protein [Planctomycetaceae bacterium]